MPTQDKLPNWALHLISRVEGLETKVTQLQREIDSCCEGRSCCGHQPATGPAKHHNPLPSSQNISTHVNTPEQQVSLSNDIASNGTSHRKCTPVHDKRSNIQGLTNVVDESDVKASHDGRRHLPTTKANKRAAEGSKKVAGMIQTNVDIQRDATLNLTRAVQSRVKEDPKKRRLTEAYDHLNAQITMNETAIDDALDYIKAIKDVDEAMAMEQHSQIMELVVSINKEKEGRANTLAALIVYSFAGKHDTLLSLLDGELSTERRSGASHEKLGAISSQIEQKDSVLETLEMHLNEQLQWVTGIPSCVSETDKALRFKALRKLSKRLIKEQAVKAQLERDVLMVFLQCDEDTRKLVKTP